MVVFTKLDRLEFKQQKLLKAEYINSGMDRAAATSRAKEECISAASEAYEESCVFVLKSKLVPHAWTDYCAVSYKRKHLRTSSMIMRLFIRVLDPESIVGLIKLTTSTLSESESLNVMWASAQMVSCLCCQIMV